jgi:hypothetical protein
MRIHSRVAAVVFAAGVAVAGLAVPAGAAPVPNAARSTNVYFENATGCDLVKTGASLDHGIWSTEVPQDVKDGQTGSWASESNGLATGTEGHATFTAYGCGNPSVNYKQVQVHWDNPFVGSNGYDEDGTDGAFTISRTGDGKGNNATINWRVAVK